MADNPHVTAVSCGAISSNYQKDRLLNVCSRIELIPLCPLWDRDGLEIMQEIIDSGLKAIIVKTACAGLDERHLGHPIDDSFLNHMVEINKKYESHVCGEGFFNF